VHASHFIRYSSKQVHGEASGIKGSHFLLIGSEIQAWRVASVGGWTKMVRVEGKEEEARLWSDS
jgi:hypothetical protein